MDREPLKGRLGRWIRDFLTIDYGLAHDELESTPPAARFDWRVAFVLIVAAVMLTLRNLDYRYPKEYAVADLARLEQFAPQAFDGLSDALYTKENEKLVRLSYWSLWQLLTYVVVPIVLIKLVLRERLSDYGLKIKGLFNYWWIYAGMYLFILPAVIVVSYTDAFQRTYPFYKLGAEEQLWPRFFIWQAFYALQFVSLEFFFRGFMVHGTKRQLGIYSIFVMMIPYCMIHFGKPFLETLGAIIAGIVLGFMSLKTRSIWLGAASHISVAMTMDFAALTHSGHLERFFKSFSSQ